jgi:hypothetical protein
MKLNFDKKQCFALPAKFYNLLNIELARVPPAGPELYAVTLNFRDPDYSASSGGYHPVEVRIEKPNDLCQLVYITDFSYCGGPSPELVKEIDVCFESKQVNCLYGGVLPQRQAIQLITLFIGNFIEYYSMGTYEIEISLDNHSMVNSPGVI